MTPRDRSLDHLAEGFRGLVFIFLARCVEAGVALFIVETRRSEEQHLEDLASGHSWIKRSKHQDGLAIDVCPYATYIEHGAKKANWDPNDETWKDIGAIGESLGLVWGGRWKQKDLGHFELKTAAPAA